MVLKPIQQLFKGAGLPDQIGIEHAEIGREHPQATHQPIHGPAIAGIISMGQEAIGPCCQALHSLTDLVVVHRHRIAHLQRQGLQTRLQLVHLQR